MIAWDSLAVGVAAHRGHLVLVRCDLAVARLQRDAESEALRLDLLHAGQRRLGVGQPGHVVVAELLAAGGHGADERAAAHLEVRAAVVGLARDEEELLLQADVADQPADVEAHQAEEPAKTPSSDGAEPRSWQA